MSNLAGIAEHYAAQYGWRVFPAKPRDKRPLFKGWQQQATSEPAVIRAWWQEHPHANVAIATGAGSGLVILDVDGDVGRASLAALEAEHGALPPTPRVITGRGGWHCYFAHPGGTIGNKAGLRPGIDLRGDGGLIVAPPSVHENGNRYEWHPDYRLSAHLLAPLPAWLLGATKTRARVTPAARADDRPSATGAGRWASVALRSEVDAAAHASPGTRNAQLNRSAFSLGQLVPGGHLERSIVESELFAAAERNGLVADDGEAQVRATIRSGLETGAKSPRGPIERAATRPAAWGAPQGDPGAIEAPSGEALTDLGNAERFARRNAGMLRYCAPWRTWMIWDGRRWTRDRDGGAERLASETVRGIYQEAEASSDASRRGALGQHAVRSESRNRIAAMLDLGRSRKRLAILPEAFDGAASRYHLTVLNGTLDLRTGTLAPHRPEDYITRLAPVTFASGARAEAWERFLERVIPSPEVRGFLQRFAGSALTGDTSDQAFALLYGTGANGKSTFLETLHALLGDYAHQASFDTFLEATARADRRGGPRADLMSLRGVRLVAAIEAGEGRRLDENTIKQLTGGDTLTTRGLYEAEETSFVPEAKLFLAANHRPEIRGDDLAIWRRVFEVPFTVTVPVDERDPGLRDRLREPGELTGLLAWALAGCREWLAGGRERLSPPPEVLLATSAYRRDQDRLAPFLSDCCVLNGRAWTTSAELRAAYVGWCERSGERPLSARALAKRIEGEGCRDERRGPAARRVRGWLGIGLLADPTTTDVDTSGRSGADSSLIPPSPPHKGGRDKVASTRPLVSTSPRSLLDSIELEVPEGAQ